MVQIGALCYSIEILYCEDLKTAIAPHPDWPNPDDPDNRPIFDLYLSDFTASEKKDKKCSLYQLNILIKMMYQIDSKRFKTVPKNRIQMAP